ncbi:MAG: hypothetical protein OXD44_12200 [Gammaproteobacteria bacterium]|nr:hypothetical protein [Gammaproteobacteria bacterium]
MKITLTIDNEMRRFLLIFAIALISGCANLTYQPHPETHDLYHSETWNCSDRFKQTVGYVFTASADTSKGIGTIAIPGLPDQDTHFVVEGLDRRWDWTLSENNGYKYALVISPAGSGRYYHFLENKTAKPRALYSCIKAIIH